MFRHADLGINTPGTTGFELLPKAKALRPDVAIMITAYGDTGMIVSETPRTALSSPKVFDSSLSSSTGC